MDCPKCGSGVWDNTQDVMSGKRKGPLMKCKDQNCDWRKWAPKGSTPQGGGGGFKARQSSGPKWTWKELSTLYSNSLKLAAKHVAATLPKALPADVVAAGATIFIAATRDGVKPEEAATAPASEGPV